MNLQIQRLQDGTELLLPFGPFARLCRDIANTLALPGTTFHWEREAFHALQEASEAYLVQLFADAQLCAVARRQKTITVLDLQHTLRLRGPIRAPFPV
jgi:histone H3/H4